MALMSYLLRDKHGTYYFRRVIPTQLRPFMPAPWTGKANWKKSLGTKDPAAAKRGASRSLSDCVADFDVGERIKRGEPSLVRLTRLPPSDDIERDMVSELLGNDAEMRSVGDARKHHQTREERAQWPDLESVEFGRKGMPDDLHYAYGFSLEEDLADYRRALSKFDPKIVEAETRMVLRKAGVSMDPLSDAYYETGLAVLRAHVKAYGLMVSRQAGEDVATPTLSARGKGPLLSEAYTAWLMGDGARGSRKPSERTRLEADYAVRRLEEWIGDARLGSITREQAREFRDALAQVPKGLPSKLRKLPLRELLKRDLKPYRPVHANTINKTLNLLRAIVNHAEASGRCDAMPAFRNPFGNGLKLIVDERAEEKREPFTAADLRAIFSLGVYRAGQRPKGGAGEAAFWLPIIALLSGARLGELVQLRVSDLAADAETGVWHISIGTEGGRSIKTASSRRKVPLHPALTELGLLAYRKSLLEGGSKVDGPLWPLLTPAAGSPWSKWFNRQLRLSAGIEDGSKVFHSFRHTFKRMARDAGVSEEVHDALTGHAGAGVGRSYGQGFGLKALAEAVGRIECPAVVMELPWNSVVP